MELAVARGTTRGSLCLGRLSGDLGRHFQDIFSLPGSKGARHSSLELELPSPQSLKLSLFP